MQPRFRVVIGAQATQKTAAYCCEDSPLPIVGLTPPVDFVSAAAIASGRAARIAVDSEQLASLALVPGMLVTIDPKCKCGFCKSLLECLSASQAGQPASLAPTVLSLDMAAPAELVQVKKRPPGKSHPTFAPAWLIWAGSLKSLLAGLLKPVAAPIERKEDDCDG